MIFVLATYFWHTVGELCLSPTGAVLRDDGGPRARRVAAHGRVVRVEFLANLGGGLVAAQVEAIERGDIALPWHLGGQADFFMLFVVAGGRGGPPDAGAVAVAPPIRARLSYCRSPKSWNS